MVVMSIWGRAISREAKTKNENNSSPATIEGTRSFWIGTREGNNLLNLIALREEWGEEIKQDSIDATRKQKNNLRGRHQQESTISQAQNGCVHTRSYRIFA
jgi:hypothetical protein